MSLFESKFAADVKLVILSCIAGAVLLSLIASGCGGDSGTGVSSTDGSSTGTLSIGLTDASTGDLQAVYVTIKEVQVHYADGDWVTAGYPGASEDAGKTYNLLELVNGVVEQLVLTELEPGNYTQMRLVLGDVPDDQNNILGSSHPYANYIVDMADNEVELKVPSGFESGIKLVHPFTISGNGETELVLDFIVQKSIIKTGNGRYILKPVIKIINSGFSSSVVCGTVTENTGDEEALPMEGVTVSAQYYDGDELVIRSATITDEDGNYKMILEEGISYNIVAYMDGYAPSCIADVFLEEGDNLNDQDFILSGTATGTVSGNISIADGVEDDSAVLSFRQECSGAVVEVKAVTVGYDTGTESWPYSGITLPAGTYTGNASTDIADPDLDERDDQQIFYQDASAFLVEDGTDTALDDIVFTVIQ